MKNTAFCSKDDSHTKMAEGYYGAYDENNNIVGWRKNIYSYPPIGTPDGGAFTTVMALDIFIRGLKKGRLLSKEMTKRILTPQSDIEINYDWGKKVTGFGFYFIYDKAGRLIRISKEGANAGVCAMVAYYPEINTTSIILGNQDCNVWELHKKIEKEILKNYK
jgi:hypothetical protein